MNVVLYSAVKKRPNSTFQPASTDGITVNGNLKEETSFLNPVIQFSDGIVQGVFSPNAFNYAQIPYWTRYYYITDWKYCNGYWEATMSVDVLASFKSEISNTSAYVTRAAGDFTGAITDNRYPAKTNVTITKVDLATSWQGVAPSGGCYVVGVLNNNLGDKIGTLNYYALTISQLNSLMNYLYSNNIFQASNISEIGEGLWKSMFNPAQYLISCMWFPFSAVSMGGNTGNIKVGYWDTGITGATIVSSLAQKTYVTGTIPNHSQANSRGSYLNHAPYTKVTLYIPPFGSIPLNMAYIEKGRYIYAPVYIDHVTGLATIRISLCQSANNLNDTNIAGERTAQIGVPISISQVMPDYLGSLQSIVGAGASLLSGNFIGAASGIMSAVDSQMPSVTTLGANGSTIETIIPSYMMVEHLLLADEDNAEFGKPLCKVKTLGTLSGYIECQEDDHAFTATISEREQINNYLKNGFFME